MSDVPTVNPQNTEIPDSEGTDHVWIDPIFAEMNPQRLADEPEPTPEEIEAQKAAEAEPPEEDKQPESEPPEGEPPAAEAKDAEKDKAAEAEPAEKAEPDGTTGKETPPAEATDKDEVQRRRREKRAVTRAREREEHIRTLEARIAEFEKSAAEASPAAEVGPQPKLEDFDHDTEKWAAAFSDWTGKTIEQGKVEARKAEEAKQREAAEAERRRVFETFLEREEGARDIYDDYDEVVQDPDLAITPEMATVIYESENGPKLAYWLGLHPEDARRIAGLSPIAGARELGRIESRIEAEEAKPAAQAEQPKPAEEAAPAEEAPPAEEASPESPPPPPEKPAKRPATQAPDPVPTVTGSAAPSRDPARMSMDEYADARRTGKLR